ncbi:MAG: NUDIX hydrolase [Deltaproteobacteria bacterium]|nr:MAG: NUDIX hydrolase [Deltaproteobacteria bacterium]
MQRPAVGVKVLILKDGKFLVLVKPNGGLDLPGGRVEGGEGLQDGLHREIREDTGLSGLGIRLENK